MSEATSPGPGAITKPAGDLPLAGDVFSASPAAEQVSNPSDRDTVVDKAPTSPTGAPAAEAPVEPVEVESRFWLRRADQVALGLLAIAALALMAVHWVRLSGGGSRPVEIDRHESRAYEYRLDLNQATWVDWIQMPGIGETLARRIIEDREQNGPFTSIDDLQRVRGIGPRTVENLRPWLVLGEM